MRYHLTLVGYLLSAAALLLGACQTRPTDQKTKETRERRQVLRTNMMSEPTTMDPRLASEIVAESMLSMLFSGLTYNHISGEVRLSLAESVQISDDLTQYQFTLKDALWSDGSILTAYHFEKSWKSCLDPAFPCEMAHLFYLIRGAKEAKLGQIPLGEVGVRALDERTLLVELVQPTPYFLSVIAHPSFAAVHPSALARPIQEAELLVGHYICSGPFRLKSFKRQSEIRLEKNPFYWDADLVQLNEVLFSMVRDQNTAFIMFENGDLDWLGMPFSEIPPDAFVHLKQTGLLHPKPVAGTRWIEFNTRKPPFNNKNIRRAFGLALHRKQLIEHVIQTPDPMGLALIPPVQKPERYRPYFQDHDIEQARIHFAQGLAELGISAAEFPEVTFHYHSSEMYHRMAQAMCEDWKAALGVRVRLEHQDWKVHLSKLTTGQFEIARYGWSATFNDPISFLEIFRSAAHASNHTGWQNPEYQRYLDLSDRSSDRALRESYLDAAEAILMEEAPLMPIYHFSDTSIHHPHVKNVFISLLHTADFRWAYLER